MVFYKFYYPNHNKLCYSFILGCIHSFNIYLLNIYYFEVKQLSTGYMSDKKYNLFSSLTNSLKSASHPHIIDKKIEKGVLEKLSNFPKLTVMA